MLTTTPPRTSYTCEAAAFTALGSAFPLGHETARTARLALRWLRSRAQDIAEQLDSPAATPAWHWLRDHHEHEHVLTRLITGQTYTFTLFEDATRYTLTARPTP